MLQTIVIGVFAGFLVTQAANFATSVYLHRTLVASCDEHEPWVWLWPSDR